MDQDQNPEDAVDPASPCSTGRTNRIGSRKIKICKNMSDQKKSLKRKAVSSDDDTSYCEDEDEDDSLDQPDDDPSYCEDEDEDDSLDQPKKVPSYRCSPHLIPELMAKLSPKQKQWVKNIDFGSLENMIDSRMPKSLTIWLLDRVHTSKGTLDVGSTSVKIKDAVVRILKLPCGNIKVPLDLIRCSKDKRPRYRGDSSHPFQKLSDNGRGITAKAATALLLQEQEDEEEFCRSFVMLVLCIYLAPTTSFNINRNYLPVLMDVSKIQLMDWCGFIADYLIQGIREFRNSNLTHVLVPGCVHMLPLIYIDLLKSEVLKVPKGEPRIHFIGTGHLALLASLDVKSQSKGHIEYGLLQDKCTKSSPPNNKKMHIPSEDAQNILPDQPNCSVSVNGKAGENVLEDMFQNLFQEIKANRDQFIQEFQRKIEFSEHTIFNNFKREYIKQFGSIHKSMPVEDNVTTQEPLEHNHLDASTNVEKTGVKNVTENPNSDSVSKSPCSNKVHSQRTSVSTSAKATKVSAKSSLIDHNSLPESSGGDLSPPEIVQHNTCPVNSKHLSPTQENSQPLMAHVRIVPDKELKSIIADEAEAIPCSIPDLGNDNIVDSTICKDIAEGHQPDHADSGSSRPTGSNTSDSDGETVSANNSQKKSGDDYNEDDIQFVSSPKAPSNTFDSQELVEISDDPESPPMDSIHIPPLQSELQKGLRFKNVGSVSIPRKNLFNRLKLSEENKAGTSKDVKETTVHPKEATKTYELHISNSKARVSTRRRNVLDANRERTKIQIKGFHISKGDFVDSLKPSGEVSQNLMGLCSVAIMCDWESKSKVILDQGTISELMKPGETCDQRSIARRLNKLNLEEIEQIYLPLLVDKHWILSVVNLLEEIVEIYDSVLTVKEGQHPHKNIWENLASNLEKAYRLARKRNVHIFSFDAHYRGINLQNNLHDCGYHVIRLLEGHNENDVTEDCKETLMAYRKYLCHILVYHRWNDLNPLRPGLREEEP